MKVQKLFKTLGFVFAVSISVLLGASCIPAMNSDPVDGPEPPTDLEIVATANSTATFEGATITLSASASGGTEPYIIRWDQNGGPEEVELTDVVNSTITTPQLEAAGLYTFRATVTDADGFHANDFVSITVESSITASAPDFAVIGEPVQLEATIDADAQVTTTMWEVVSGTATIDDPTALSPMLTTLVGETVDVRFTASIPVSDGEPITSTREFKIVSVPDLHPQVLFTTNLGNFTLELDGEAAPLHMVNFLLYADEGFYDETVIHRVVCTEADEEGEPCQPFVIQGGGYEPIDGELELKEVSRDPVMREDDNGLSNGTVYSFALALTGGNPDSGDTQFFVNLDPENDFLDDQGFTVFGLIVEGTDVIDTIAMVPTVDSPFLPGEMSLPEDDIVVESVTRINP